MHGPHAVMSCETRLSWITKNREGVSAMLWEGAPPQSIGHARKRISPCMEHPAFLPSLHGMPSAESMHVQWRHDRLLRHGHAKRVGRRLELLEQQGLPGRAARGAVPTWSWACAAAAANRHAQDHVQNTKAETQHKSEQFERNMVMCMRRGRCRCRSACWRPCWIHHR